MTTLSVAKQNSDGHREELARINLDSNKSLVTTATNWSANQTQIYGNVALQVTKVNVTCLDDGLYLCLATFYHNQTKVHQELFQSFLIDVVDRRVETNQPLIQTEQCQSQQVCCVEQNQTINVTCSVNTTSMSELQLLYPIHDAENVRRQNQTELNVREKSLCPVYIKTSDVTIVSVQTDKVITCQILEARSEVKIMVQQKQSMPNIFATQCPQESRCSVIRNSKVQLVCSLKTRATPLAFPLELYYISNNEEISIAEMPSKIEVSKASIKFNRSSRSECAEYFLQYNLTIQSLESSTQFKCKYFSWTSSVVVTVSKHEWINNSLSISFSILWLIPIIFGPLVISIMAGVLHVLFLKKTIERKMTVSQTSIVVSSVAELPRIKLTKGAKSFIPGESTV
ncbi:hypothetical protein Bpfe_001724 [Biomphalaria pfeifferi]|uniref:Uncharacterized protein n=1 Tax=Biomphalaria pfeifferi TaxID=112525 RepID=A0AAD8C986_BIOPF|nr:hypothetical protein Bpfe_001724 [Biomphalaria pfeifferi]